MVDAWGDVVVTLPSPAPSPAPSPVPSLADLAGDPHPHLARLRDAGPVHWLDELGGFLIVRHQAAVEVLRDPVTFTVDDPRFSTAQVVGRSMLSADGDDHIRHRLPFTGVFRRRQVHERFGADVERHIARLVGSVVAQSGRAELRSAVAGPVAAAVMATTLGLNGDDPAVSAELLAWYGHIVASVAGVAESRPVTAEGAAAMRALATRLWEHRDVPSVLADAAAAGTLSDEELASNAGVLLFGGIETTEAMILNALWWYLGDPDSGRGDPIDVSAVAAVVEEGLRIEPAVAMLDRYTTCDATIGDVEIAAGALVSISVTACNRDPEVFDEPDSFRPERAALRRHLAFATGPHVCLGMDLARLEAVATIVALLQRLPGLRLAEGTPPPTGLVFRKPQRLDVEWEAAAV